MRHNGGTNPVRKRSPPNMCRPQPGPRCPKHSSARIASHLATRKRIQDRLARAKPNTLGYERAAQDLADIDDTLANEARLRQAHRLADAAAKGREV